MKLIILQKNNLCKPGDYIDNNEHLSLCAQNKELNMQYPNQHVLTVSLLLSEKHDPKEQAPMLWRFP